MNGAFKHFLNEPKEWHALWLGLCRSLYPPVNLIRIDEKLRLDVIEEYHYHLLGFAIGRVVQIVTLLFIGARI